MGEISNKIPKAKKSVYSIVGKRILDILFSGIAIICLSWLFLLLAILELIFHGKPIIYKQQRIGLHGKAFDIYKFRSMTNEKDENGKLLPGEKRITNFGKIIRRFSLDELPELFCIFSGKMSIIGPRPLLPQYLEYYTARHMMRHEVKPGLAIVNLKQQKSWTWREQFENDIFYIENISLKLDIQMFYAILKEAMVGSEYRVNDTREKFSPEYWKEG